MPPAFTTESIRPCSFSIALIVVRTFSSEPKSKRWYVALPPPLFTSSTTDFKPDSLTSSAMTWAPRRASRIADARPIPLAAPVTTEICPA